VLPLVHPISAERLIESLSRCIRFHLFFFFSCFGDHRVLLSFPTRRSSDLPVSVQLIHGGIQVVLVEVFGGLIQATGRGQQGAARSEEHTSELQSREKLVCRLLLEKKTEATAIPRLTSCL